MDRQRIRTFLLGTLAGALAGILLAPRSGRELRGDLADRAGEARERGREAYFDVQERTRERVSESRRRGPSTTAEPVFRQPPDEPPPVADLGTRRPPDAAPGPTALRDVSRGEPGSDAAADAGSDAAQDERSEELRRKVRETRERLRQRLDGPRGVVDDPVEGEPEGGDREDRDRG